VCPNLAVLYPPDRADRAFEHRAPDADVLKLDRFDCIGIVFEHGRHLYNAVGARNVLARMRVLRAIVEILS
jgi:hypothetical protein